MKNIVTNTITNILPKFSFLAEPKFILIATPPVVVVSTLIVDFYSVAFILGIAFIADFVTGIAGSYFVWRSSPDRTEKWFFGKGEGFSSDKFKKMFVKLIVYLVTPIVVVKFQEVFHLKRIKYEVLSAAEMDISTVILLLFILNEGFSIFHENLPKCGFNLWKIIKNLIGVYKGVKKELKED